MGNFINGELYVNDGRWCNNNEVVRESFTNDKERTIDEISEELFGYDYMDGHLYQSYGLMINDGEIEPISEEQFQKDCDNPLNIENLTYKTVVEVN